MSLSPFFNDFFADQRSPSSWDLARVNSDYWPKLDVSEDDKQITVHAEMAGITKDDIDLHVSDGLLTIKGEKRCRTETTGPEGEKDESKKWHRIESRSGKFSRSLRLPKGVEEKDIVADCTDGVLKVTIPKQKDSPVPTKIEIK